MKRFLERDHDVRLDVASPFGFWPPLSERASSESSLTASPEKRLEKVAEPGAPEFELNSAAVTAGRIPAKSAPRLPIPSRRRLKSAGLIPVRAEFVVLLSLLRIPEDFVGFVD